MGKTFLKNSLFNVGYRVLNVLFPLITSMYVSRIIGPSGVGRVDYAQNILSYFLIFASTGIPVYGIREIARNSNNKYSLNKSFSELVIINSITTMLCIIAYVILVLSISAIYSDKEVFFAIGISLFLNFFNIDWFYAGIEEYVYIAIRSSAVKILSIIGLFLFVRTKNDVINYAFISGFGLSANYLLNIVNVREKAVLIFNGLEFKKHIKPIAILLMTLLATDLYNQVDITMMGNICSKAEIGCYSYAIKIIRIVTSITTAISATMLPRLSQYYVESKKDEFECFTNRVMSTVILLAMPCFLGIALCSKNIITVLYGKEFARAIPLLKEVSPIILIISISYLCGSIVLTAINKEKYLLYATLSGAGINIVLNSLLIPIFHGEGAVIASVVAELCVLMMHWFFSKGYVHYHFATVDNAKVLLAAIIMTMIIYVLKRAIPNPVVNLFASVVIGAGIYFVILFVTKHEVFMKCILTIANRFKTKYVE